MKSKWAAFYIVAFFVSEKLRHKSPVSNCVSKDNLNKQSKWKNIAADFSLFYVCMYVHTVDMTGSVHVLSLAKPYAQTHSLEEYVHYSKRVLYPPRHLN